TQQIQSSPVQQAAAAHETSKAIISTIKEYINHNMVTQASLINKLNERIDSCLSQQVHNDQKTQEPATQEPPAAI
ncbi:35020_t:CDS:2, partial [Racocetra persica]